MRTGTTLGAVMIAAASVAAWAQPGRVDLVPEATRVTFTLDATGHTVEGSFAVRSGSVTFDPETGTAAGEIVVDLSTGKTGNARRDANMHEDVLESAKYPTAVLRLKRTVGRIPSGGEADVKVEGVLTLHGSDHEVALPLRVAVDGHTVRAVGEFRVPYVAWGLEDPSVFVLRVAKEVTVRVEARGTLTSGPIPRTP